MKKKSIILFLLLIFIIIFIFSGCANDKEINDGRVRARMPTGEEMRRSDKIPRTLFFAYAIDKEFSNYEEIYIDLACGASGLETDLYTLEIKAISVEGYSFDREKMNEVRDLFENDSSDIVTTLLTIDDFNPKNYPYPQKIKDVTYTTVKLPLSLIEYDSGRIILHIHYGGQTLLYLFYHMDNNVITFYNKEPTPK